MSRAADRACDNCGGALIGDYCHRCGAPDLASRPRSVHGILEELAEVFTSVEHSKVLRTLQALLFRPGLLTRDYFTGRRISFLRPLTLCLTILALHLFVYSLSQRATMFDVGKVAAQTDDFLRSRGMDTRDSMAALIARGAASQNVPVSELHDRINARWARNVSFFQIPLIVLFAGVLLLAYLRSKRFAAEHFVFSTHYISFQVLFQVVMWPFYYLVGVHLSAGTILVSLTTNAISLGYLFFAVRAFYEDSFKQALIRAPLLYAGYAVVTALLYQAAMLLALRSALG